MSLARYLHNPEMILRKMAWTVLLSRQRGAEVTTDTWNGRLTFNSADGLIGKFLFVRRAYEQDYVTRAIEYLDRAGLRSAQRDVVLDVGANIGMIGIALVKHGWFRRAIAFEPEPCNFQLLTRNVHQNGYDEAIDCRQLALSCEAGHLDLVLDQGNSGGHFIQTAVESPTTTLAGSTLASSSVRIKTVTCDEILAADFSRLADRIGLVWVDIEGHEGHFLQGAAATLARGVPVVSEFFPKAIERSGLSRQEYLRQVGQLFTHVCTLSNGQFVEQPISTVKDLFAAYYHRGATNVIYLRR
jgi:FkbM family methyltransferase